jgi:hypothetical protein
VLRTQSLPELRPDLVTTLTHLESYYFSRHDLSKKFAQKIIRRVKNNFAQKNFYLSKHKQVLFLNTK